MSLRRDTLRFLWIYIMITILLISMTINFKSNLPPFKIFSIEVNFATFLGMYSVLSYFWGMYIVYQDNKLSMKIHRTVSVLIGVLSAVQAFNVIYDMYFRKLYGSAKIINLIYNLILTAFTSHLWWTMYKYEDYSTLKERIRKYDCEY